MEFYEVLSDIVVALMAVAAFVLSIITYVVGVKRARKQATIEYFSMLEKEALLELDSIMPSKIKEISAKKTSVEYKQTEALIARIEHFCAGVNNDVFDKHVAYDLCHGFFENRIWPRVYEFIGEDGKYKDDYYSNIREFKKNMEIKLKGKKN